MKRITLHVAFTLLVSGFVLAQINQPAPPVQTTNDPFPTPIPAADRVITVKFSEFATIPDFNNAAPRIMTMVYEPGTRRYFASDMNGRLFAISSDGKTVTEYLDLRAPEWNVAVQAQNSERGFQSFAFHPQFRHRGSRGFGKFYTSV